MGLRSYPYSQLERRDRDSVTPRGQRSARTPDTPPTGFSGADRNPNTRAAYAQAVKQFCAFCDQHRITLERVSPIIVAAYIEQLQGRLRAPRSHARAAR